MLTAAGIAHLIGTGQPVPVHLRAITSNTISDSTPLDATLAVEQYIQIGKGVTVIAPVGKSIGISKLPKTLRSRNSTSNF
jgi:hypothetical protein